MTLYVFDTDHISLQQRADPAVVQRLRTLRAEDSVATTAITVEEQVRGRLELIRRHSTSTLQVAAYAAFQQTLHYFTVWQVLGFTQVAFDHVVASRQQRIRIGSQDLRIAAITLSNHAVLVTRNTRDFVQLPGLIIRDWSAS